MLGSVLAQDRVQLVMLCLQYIARFLSLDAQDPDRIGAVLKGVFQVIIAVRIIEDLVFLLAVSVAVRVASALLRVIGEGQRM